jgi:hypothetical protein
MAWLLYEKDSPRFRGLVIRLNAKDLADWLDRARWMYRGTGAQFVGSPAEMRFPSGAVIRTGHLKDDSAYTQYQGHEYQRILIEELTQIPQEKYYEQLISSCRSTVMDLKPQIFATTNPGGVGHEWVKHRWGIPDVPLSNIFKETQFGNRVFIPSKVYDNPRLIDNDPNYVKQLENIKDESLRKAWLEGSWGNPIIEGSIYREDFQRLELAGRITEVPWNPQYPVYTYWDIGRDATPILFLQKVGEAWHMIDFYEASNQDFAHFAGILRSKPYWYGEHFGPHDLRKTDMSNETILGIAERFGINFTVVAKDDIADGIQAVKLKLSLLKVDKANCPEFLRRIRAYRREWDDDKQIFKDAPKHDWASHAADALRYWAVHPDPVPPGAYADNEHPLYASNYN